MKSYTSYFFIIAFFLITSCTEDYQLPNLGSKTTIVITGMITNEPGLYYVTVWEYVSNISTGKTIRRDINDAWVTITDNKGNVDELQSFFTVPIEKELYVPDPVYNPDFSYYLYFYKIPDGKGGYIRFSTASHFDTREGRYFSTSIKGQPGQAYTLKVEYAGKEYISTDYMCYGTVIDSVSLEPIGKYIYNKPDGEDGFLVPCLYFAEPQEETNFYMFNAYTNFYANQANSLEPLKNTALELIFQSGYYSWPVSVISDRFLPSYVYKYKLSDGDSDRKYLSGSDMGFERWEYDEIGVVQLYCITEPVYRYFMELSRQYYYDGGAFSPSPASPPTNISGGAQGCFIAASVSQYVLDLRKEK